jgi:hypothetical protein
MNCYYLPLDVSCISAPLHLPSFLSRSQNVAQQIAVLQTERERVSELNAGCGGLDRLPPVKTSVFCLFTCGGFV